MAAGDFQNTIGKQRAVWAQSGGTVLVGNQFEHFEAVVIESGTAVREPYFQLDGTYVQSKVTIPIMIVPSAAKVLKTVAMASPATIHWNEDADPSAIWGVEHAEVNLNTATRQLSLVANVIGGGKKTDMPAISYHITIFIQAEDANPRLLLELDSA